MELKKLRQIESQYPAEMFENLFPRVSKLEISKAK